MNRLHKLKKLFHIQTKYVKSFAILNKINQSKLIGFSTIIGFSYLIYDNQTIKKAFAAAPTMGRWSNDNIIVTKRKPTNDKVNKTVDTSDKVSENTDKSDIQPSQTKEVKKIEQKEKVSLFDESIQEEFPLDVPYLIIGGGIAGFSAAATIRASDPFAKVLIINNDPDKSNYQSDSIEYPPYRRIMLSKYLWRNSDSHLNKLLDPEGDVKNHSILFLEPNNFYLNPLKLNQCKYGGIALMKGHKVLELNAEDQTVTIDGIDKKIHYQTCLLATGSKPRRLEYLEKCKDSEDNFYEQGKVTYFRGINDFRYLFEKVKQLKNSENPGRILIIGSGLLGTELSSTIGRLSDKMKELQILVAFREPSHLSHLLPRELSLYITKSMSKYCHEVLVQSEAISVNPSPNDPNKMQVTFKSLQKYQDNELITLEDVDHIVVAAGVEPNTELAQSARLELDPVNGGYLVNAELSARNNLFVAGDACSFYDAELGRRRVEHWGHAEESGEIAGHNMAAKVLSSRGPDALNQIPHRDKSAVDVTRPRIYDYQSAFSFKLSMYKTMQAIGKVDSSLETRVYMIDDLWEQNFDSDNVRTDTAPSLDKEIEPVKLNELDMPGLVLYIQHRRIVGILLWNCDDDILVESDLNSPKRMSLARKILHDRSAFTDDEAFRKIARDFDLGFYLNSQVQALDQFKETMKDMQISSNELPELQNN